MHNGLQSLKISRSSLNIFHRSPPIKIEDIGSVHLRLRYPGREQEPVQLIRGDVRIDGPTIFISFSSATEAWPFTIENDSDYTATVCQKVRSIQYLVRSCSSRVGFQLRGRGCLQQNQCPVHSELQDKSSLCVGLSCCQGQEDYFIDQRFPPSHRYHGDWKPRSLQVQCEISYPLSFRSSHGV
jgi:hypothetical protein